MTNESAPNAPDFSTMEINSIGKRKFFDRGFLVLCIATSMISIVILGILLSSIAVKAMATFGAHEDTFESEARWLIVQGSNPDNDPEKVDEGDLIQSVFVVKNLDRGGLGKTNDTKFDQQQQLIGLGSYRVESQIKDHVFRLGPAPGENNVVEIAKRLQAIPDEAWAQEIQSNASNATFLLLENPSATFDLKNLKAGKTLFDDGKLTGEIIPDTGWETVLVGGHDETNFSILDLSVVDSEMAKIAKVRLKKRGGMFQSLCSVLAHNLGDEVKFKPVKLRQLSSDAIVEGDLKFADSKLIGISRRKKNGFTLADKFDLRYCPTPEINASTSQHVRHFLTETNKTVAAEIGIGPALTGTLWVCIGCALFALPLGVGTAVFLEEFQPTNRFLRFFHGLVQVNITNLAGVPSIVYGILGLTAFAGMFGLFGLSKDPFIEVGASHYYQYLSEGNKSILVPVSADSRSIARRLEMIRKNQKLMFRTSYQGIERPLKLNRSVNSRHDKFKADLAEIDSQLTDPSVKAASQTAIETMDVLCNQLDQEFDQDKLVDLAKRSEIALRELVAVIQKPKLTDGMQVFSSDYKPMELTVINEGETLPEDPQILKTSLRSTAVGGPMSQKRWYYFRLPFGRSVLAASLTLMLVILPVIIIASQEALRAVPPSLRECALGLGSTPWQVVRNVTLPAAIPSIMTGAILAMSRAIGEAAPILVICGILFVSTGPSHLMDFFSILPIQIYDTTKLPLDQEEMINSQNVAAAGIVVLLAILLTFNAVAITIRQWMQKPLT